GAKFAGGIDHHWHAGAAGDRFIVDSTNVGGRLSRFANASGVGFTSFAEHAGADDDVVAASGKTLACLVTHGDVIGAGGILFQSFETGGGVIRTVIVVESVHPRGGVLVAGGVLPERADTDTGVVAA